VICRKHKSPKNVLAAVKTAARIEEIKKHGKLIIGLSLVIWFLSVIAMGM
jgi:hypothetical protein